MVFCSFAISAATEHPAFAGIKDVAHFEMLTPNTTFLVRGKRLGISATIKMVSDAGEAIESNALLTVNGQSFKPFYAIITPGDIAITQKFTWFTVVHGDKSMTLRFRFIVIGNTSKIGYEVVDLTRDYKIVSPKHRRKRIGACKIPCHPPLMY